MNIPDVLIPAWPSGYAAWDTLTTLVWLGLLKVIRGTIMEHRSPTVDRMGWSFIWFDWVLGGAYLLAAVWTLYSGLMFQAWGPHVVNAAVKIVVTWQFIEILVADPFRVHAAVSGNGHGKQAATWPDVERRVGPKDRRAEDRELRGIS